MTADEFQRWYRRYMAFFPETERWLNRLEGERRREVLEAWRGLLSDVELRDALAVAELMFADDNESYPRLGERFGDVERTASHTRKLARLLRFDRRQREIQRREERQREAEEATRRVEGRKRYKYSMAQGYRWFRQALREQSRQDALAGLRAMLDEPADPGDDGYPAASGWRQVAEGSAKPPPAEDPQAELPFATQDEQEPAADAMRPSDGPRDPQTQKSR